MTIQIPSWLLWALGLGLSLPAVVLLVIGAVTVFTLWRGW